MKLPEQPGLITKEIERFEGLLGAKVGLMALHLDSGQTLQFNSDVLFPLVSTVRLAIAGTVLQMIDQGILTLETLIPIELPQQGTGNPWVERCLEADGVSRSVASLLEAMLVRHDEKAKNFLMAAVGAPENVAHYFDQLHIKDLRPDGLRAGLMPDLYNDLERFPYTSAVVILDQWRSRLSEVQQANLQELHRSVNNNTPRDQGTPRAVVEWLRYLWQAEEIRPDSRNLLLSLLRQTTPASSVGPRLRRHLPVDTVVMNKTGTARDTLADIGFILLPQRLGVIAIALFVQNSYKPREYQEQIMGDLARLAYDYFLMTAAFFQDQSLDNQTV